MHRLSNYIVIISVFHELI